MLFWQGCFFEVSACYDRLDSHGDPLLLLDTHIDWSGLEDLMCDIAFSNGGKGGRKPLCGLMMAKIMLLQSLYNLSDDAVEYQINDRLSFKRFIGLNVGQKSPDAKTIWVWRDRVKKRNLHHKIFAWFENEVSQKGYTANSGQIVDASFVPTHKPTSKHNKQIKDNIPLSTRQCEQRDTDASFTRKGGIQYHGYKNHIQIDNKHKIIRKWCATPAHVHDSQCIDALVSSVVEHADKQDLRVWGDSAYRSAKIEGLLKQKGLISLIHYRRYRNTPPLNDKQKKSNLARSKTRCRIEHVFGQMATGMGGVMIHTIGLIRAEVKIAFKNIAYNMQRFAMLESRRKNPPQCV